MSILCSCRVISDRDLKCRSDLPSFNGDWAKVFEAISGEGPKCGGCEEDLEGIPFPEQDTDNNQKIEIQGESTMPIEPWSPPTSSPIPPYYLAQNFATAQEPPEPATESEVINERDYPTVAYASRPQDWGI